MIIKNQFQKLQSIDNQDHQLANRNKYIVVSLIVLLILQVLLFVVVQQNHLFIKSQQKKKRSAWLETPNYPLGVLPPFQDGTTEKEYIPLPHQKHQIPWQTNTKLKRQVTLVINSSDRFDLLRKTIDSFMKMNTFPVKQSIVMNDGPETEEYRKLAKEYPNIKFLSTGQKVGQLIALDMLYDKVETDYFFHSEDDWKYIKPGFIEYSMNRMEMDPRINFVRLKGFRSNSKEYSHQVRDSTMAFRGLSFNPSLRRLRDHKFIGKFSQITNNSTYGVGAGTVQQFLSTFYSEHGYYCLVSIQKFILHTGYKRALSRNQQLQYNTKDPVADQR